ncbi:hypothetical protein MHYP_G00293160 [Metynnis hypsauchen]
MCEVFEGPAVVSMELLWSVQHLLCVFTVYLLRLQPSEGNSESVFQCLSCYNQSSAHSLHMSPPHQLTGPASCIRLCLQQRCFGSGSVPHGDVWSVGPYVHDVAVDDLIGSLHTGKPHPQLSACVAASTLQNTAVQIYTEKRAYAAGTDVMFLAVTEEADPLEFHWQFGDSVTFTTRSRTFIKRFFLPQRYNVTVRVSNALQSVSSEIYSVVIQTAVQPNRLLFMPSVLLDTSVRFTCRIDAGTNVSYVWDFGDGTQRVGHSTEHHLFNRTGEFIVEVTVFNLVSCASLKGHLFVVSEPCQPPSVKNMGPSKIQVWRYQPVSIGVTFESQIQCNISSGLLYTWFLYKPNGQQLHIPLIQTNRQSLELPAYLLHCGAYKAVAKVEVVGSIVYSNYSVQIEVMSSLPVSVISGGTNLLINRNNSNIITLDGQKSYDPDYPGYAMSYRWKCRPVNSAKSSCFRENLPDSSAVLMFPARALQPDCDLFKFTLTVHSANRSSSSHIFITVRSKPTSFVHISCKECRGNSINWNEPFSVTAMCENCPETVTYSWKLYSVNASSKTAPGGPFCSSVDISLPSKMEEDNLLFKKSEVTTQTSAVSHSDKISSHYPSNSTGSVLLAQIWNKMSSSSDDSPDMSNIYHTTISKASEVTSTSPLPFLFPNSRHLAGEKKSYRSKSRSERSVEHQEEPLAPFDLLSGLDSASAVESSGASSEDDYFYAVDTEDENTNKNNATFKHSSIHGDLDYEYFYSGMEEADVGEPVGRPTGPDSLDDGVFHSDEHEGDNLVDPSSVGRLVVSEKTLLDLNRELIQPALFQSYTFTGTSSPSITFKPTSLKPKSLYMLEVSASFDQALQGKAQLFFSTHSIPEGMACHVQPSTGLEIHTHFSIFCTSGRQDLLYAYSFSVGNSTKKLLYEGRDFQHYFNLPAGDPYNNYEGNLTSLTLMRNSRDIINYVYLLTVRLNRLSLDPESSIKLQTETRAALISAVCQLTVYSKDLLLDILHTLTDLLNASNQVTFDSAILVTKYIHRISSLRETNLPASHILDVNVVKAVVFVLSNVLDAPIPSSRAGIQLTQHVLHGITDSVLMFMHSSKYPQVSVNTTTMNLLAWQHYGSHPTVKTIHTTTFYIPDLLDMQIKQRRNTAEQSFITQLISYKQNPYHWTRTSVQLNGDVSEVKLFNCTSRREIKKRYLSTPVVVEFQKPEEINKSKDMRFTLARSEVNIHLFSITPELLQKTLQLRVEFNRPTRRAFPIMLLFRMHKKPTLTLYNIQKVYRWKESMVQIFLPPSSLKDAGTAYVMLLNADYNKSPINKYTANAVNYTLSIESIQCLAWDGLREWRPDSCSVLKGFSTIRINCSTPCSLGQVRGVHLWHDASGSSPSWFLSRVLVKDLLQGCSWIFQAQCWLAVDEGDGRVERRLQALEQKLTFREYSSELGLIGVSPVSVVTGLCALALLPVGSLVSYLFRISKILIIAICATLRCKEQSYFYQISTFDEPVTELLKQNKQSRVCFNKHFTSCSHHQPEEISMYYEKVLASRKRERYLRLTRPPTSTQLKYVRCQIKKRTLIRKTIRDLMLYMITLSTAGFVAYGKFPNDMFHLNQAVTTSFSRHWHRPLNSFQKPEAWWDWAENAILDGLYQQNTSYDVKENNAKTLRGNFFRIGDPVIKKMESTNSLSRIFRFSGLSNRPHLCGKLGCYEGAGIHLRLGKNRSEVSSTLQKLRTTGWMDRNTEAMIVQFTLYSPAHNLFTTVTMLEEQPPIEGFQPAVFIHSTRLYNSATALDYWLIAAELLFLLLTLLQLYIQICVMAQKAWLYWTNLWNWLEVLSLLISFLSFICAVQHFTLRTDTIEHLQREDFKKFVDVSPVSSWEQFSCLLHGLLVFLLLMKCCFMLRINEVMTAAVSSMALIFSNLLWLLVTGAVTSFVRKAAKSRRRKTHLSVSDLLTYTRDMILVLIGKSRQNWMDNHNANNLYLEEFEDLVDELLLQLNVISHSDTLEEQENHKNQSCLSFAHDYSSEDAEEEKMMTPIELEPSCACSIASYIHEDCSHRSPLVWKTLQPFGGSRGMTYDRPISTDQKIRRNSTVVPGKKRKDSQTLLCVMSTQPPPVLFE